MTGKQLKAVRQRMGLSQRALAGRLRVAENTVTRMENSRQAITPAMELLLSYIAKEYGIDVAHSQRSGRGAEGKRAHAKAAKTPKG